MTPPAEAPERDTRFRAPNGNPGHGLTDAQRCVAEFHEAFGHPTERLPGALNESRARAREAWMREELDEFLAASDLIGQADAMVDLIYFALGTLVELGVDGGQLFEVVHEANMKKLGPNGKPLVREDGKIAKPAGWVDPTATLRNRLVEEHSKYKLVVADDLGCVAASLAMVAHATGFPEYSRERFAQVLPPVVEPPEGEDAADFSRFGVVMQIGSLDPYLEAAGIPLIDDFLGIEFISEMSFPDVLREALARYDALAVGFDASFVYPDAPNFGHFATVADIDSARALLVDPGPLTAGLASVKLDDLFTAIRAKKDGLHRFKVRPGQTPRKSPTVDEEVA